MPTFYLYTWPLHIYLTLCIHSYDDHVCSEGSVESNDELTAYQRSRSNLRRQAISASLFNATSMKDVLRYSCDNLQSMNSGDDLVTMVGGAKYGKEEEYRGADEQSESSGTRYPTSTLSALYYHCMIINVGT